jgi:hypothetical protein
MPTTHRDARRHVASARGEQHPDQHERPSDRVVVRTVDERHDDERVQAQERHAERFARRPSDQQDRAERGERREELEAHPVPARRCPRDRDHARRERRERGTVQRRSVPPVLAHPLQERVVPERRRVGRVRIAVVHQQHPPVHRVRPHVAGLARWEGRSRQQQTGREDQDRPSGQPSPSRRAGDHRDEYDARDAHRGDVQPPGLR